MWRYVAGAAATLLMVAAGVLLFRAGAHPDPVLPAQPAAASATQAAEQADEPLPDTVPEATSRTREQKRFDRYDKDRDGKITRDEYLAQRRKAYAKLDTNGDGRLSFEEWAAKTIGKFTGADADRSNTMSATEFATTAPKRKARARVNCPPAAAPARDED